MGTELGIMVKAIIWPLARLTFFTALVRGGLLWLEESHQIYIDRWIASMIGAAESMAVQAPGWVGWALAGATGLVAMTVWEVCTRMFRRGKKDLFPKADLERWRSNNEMKIWQAGCLWEGVEPGYPVKFKNPAYSKFSMLLSAAETGELELVLKKPEDKLAHSIVSRNNLIDYANKRNIEIPEFLEAKSTPTTPLKPAATARLGVRLSDALYRIIDNSGWVSKFGRDSFLDQAENALRQAARDEEITIRGRREIDRYGAGDHFDQTWENIEPSYWRTHEFELAAIMCAEPHYATCETAVVSPGDITAESMPHYAMLRVWDDELKKLWPAANT